MESTIQENIQLKGCQLYANYQNRKYLLPLKSQKVDARVLNSIATIEIAQKYVNDTTDPLEIILNIPMEEEYAIGKLVIQIDEQVIEGKILEKEKA